MDTRIDFRSGEFCWRFDRSQVDCPERSQVDRNCSDDHNRDFRNKTLVLLTKLKLDTSSILSGRLDAAIPGSIFEKRKGVSIHATGAFCHLIMQDGLDAPIFRKLFSVDISKRSFHGFGSFFDE